MYIYVCVLVASFLTFFVISALFRWLVSTNAHRCFFLELFLFLSFVVVFVLCVFFVVSFFKLQSLMLAALLVAC